MVQKMALAAERHELTERLSALGALCRLLSAGYATPPDEAMLAALRDVDEGEDLLLACGGRAAEDGLRQVAEYCRQPDLAAAAEAAAVDHCRLFLGPGRVVAPPWASVYVGLGLLFAEPARRAGRAYREFGLEVPRPEQEPADHIAYELAFVAELDRRAANALLEGDLRLAEQAQQGAQAFLRDQMLPWSGVFLQRVEANARTGFYRGLAQITRAVLALHAQAVPD